MTTDDRWVCQDYVRMTSNASVITVPGPSVGISQRDSLVILLKKYGIFSRRLQNRLHPAARSSGGRSWTGSGDRGAGPGDMYASPGVLGMPTGWLSWPAGVFGVGVLGLVLVAPPGEPVSVTDCSVVLIVNLIGPDCCSGACDVIGITFVGMATLLSLMVATWCQSSVALLFHVPRQSSHYYCCHLAAIQSLKMCTG